MDFVPEEKKNDDKISEQRNNETASKDTKAEKEMQKMIKAFS